MKKVVSRILSSCARAWVVAAVLLVLGSALAPRAKAVAGCTLATLSGTQYAGVWTGAHMGENYDALMVGSFNYVSGTSGTFNSSLTYAMAGSTGTASVAATYWLSSGTYCEYTITFNTPFSASFFVVYLPNSLQLKWIETDANGTMASTEWQIPGSGCSNNPNTNPGSDNFVGEWMATVGGKAYDAAEISTFGALTSGSGTYSGQLTYDLAGSSTGPATVTGTYDFPSKGSPPTTCEGTILAGGLTFTFVFVPTTYTTGGSSQDDPVIVMAETDGKGIMANTEFRQF